MSHSPPITIVGAGLAGCEAALQLASRGIPVRLLEQKPIQRTAAQSSDELCELVCSNSFRGTALSNAVGLLKEEMRRLGSFTILTADACRVPAGGALAVDRERFSREISRRVHEHPLIERVATVVGRIPSERPLVLATGPLTGSELASDIERLVGSDSLAYYDAIAPVVSAESIDWDQAFLASRWGKGQDEADRMAYANLPLDEAGYRAFVAELVAAEKVPARAFEEPRYFEGCLPIEVMAARGEMTLAFGPMKPVGLTDPRTGRRPFAVVQLRKEDRAGTAYNLVGFQTRMTWGEQKRVFRSIPGLGAAEFERFGAVHRNTFIDAPRLLDPTLRLRGETSLYFAGQITGVEGYVESAACGWLVAHVIAARVSGREPVLPPATTAHGGLLEQLRRGEGAYQPSNITFSHIAPWEGSRLKKREKYEAMAGRALAALEEWSRDSVQNPPSSQ
jgi:methylenetetrahydrofolate--tRNA-(uracil-5-)-methyltransferase